MATVERSTSGNAPVLEVLMSPISEVTRQYLTVSVTICFGSTKLWRAYTTTKTMKVYILEADASQRVS